MKKLLSFLLVFLMIASLAACAKAEPETPEVPTGTTAATTAATDGDTVADPEDGKNTITVKVVHSDGSEKTFTYKTDAEFLGDVLLDAGLIKGNDGPYGLEVTHVDGEQAIYTEDGAYWALYEGDQYALQGVSTTPVVDGATYGYVYTEA